MSKSFKDKANYYLHHLKNDDPYRSNQAKMKIDPEDVPASIKPKMAELNYDWNSGLRNGNNRKYLAKEKVSERRSKRAKERNNFKKEIDSY